MPAERARGGSPRRVPRALIVLDGLGDRANPSLGGKTPLEAARTPFLDRLAGLGRLGTVLPVGPGIAPESDAGVLGLLGYDPRVDSPGRGVLEAEGVGLHVADGEIAFRFNFATIGTDDRVLDSRVGRSLSTAEASELAAALERADLLRAEHVEVRVLATVGHRGVLRMRRTDGGRLSPEISNSDPFYAKSGGLGHALKPADPHVLEVHALDASALAKETARLVNRFAEGVPPILREHPVNVRRRAEGSKEGNGLLLRDAGTAPRHLRPFRSLWGVPGAALTEMPVERGLARLLELEDVFVGPVDPTQRAAGYAERARKCRELLERHPFLYVHLKGPDEPGHDGDAPRKREIVEALDAHFFGPLLRDLDLSAVELMVTADHATPCVLKAHSDDPVPVLLVGGGKAPPRPTPGSPRFTEETAAHGSLGAMVGKQLLTRLFADPTSAG